MSYNSEDVEAARRMTMQLSKLINKHAKNFPIVSDKVTTEELDLFKRRIREHMQDLLYLTEAVRQILEEETERLVE